MIELAELGIAVNLAVAAAAAAMVWTASVRTTRHTDVVGVRSGMGHALIGCDACDD
jgi:hypothetical protein